MTVTGVAAIVLSLGLSVVVLAPACAALVVGLLEGMVLPDYTEAFRGAPPATGLGPRRTADFRRS